MSRRALCSAGSLRFGSPASSLLRRAPTPRRPSRRASLPSLSDTAAIQRPETARPPKFLGDPPAYVPRLYGPGGTSGAGLPGLAVPTYRSSGVAFRADRLVGFHDENISGSSSAARVLAVYASQLGSPRDHARLASGWQPCLGRAGVVTRWVTLQGFSSLLWLYMASSLSRLAWRTVGRSSALGRDAGPSPLNTGSVKSFSARPALDVLPCWPFFGPICSYAL